jgi:hypothetical protein
LLLRAALALAWCVELDTVLHALKSTRSVALQHSFYILSSKLASRHGTISTYTLWLSLLLHCGNRLLPTVAECLFRAFVAKYHDKMLRSDEYYCVLSSVSSARLCRVCTLLLHSSNLFSQREIITY